ncbi:MAG: hypothetical protein NVS2B8_16660 [Vulcanimicrobiaceae bacterium]
MQRDRIEAARLWLSNAATDVDVADSLRQRFAARSCFHAQQASEMALEAALIALADDHPRTHVAEHLIRELVVLGEAVPQEIAAAADRLDMYYMGSRYPDALGGADPRRMVAESDAIVAIERARTILAFAGSIVERVAAEPT